MSTLDGAFRHCSSTIEKVVEILQERVEESGRSCRAIEVQARWPIGTLALVLTRRNPVTLNQLETLAEILGFRVFDVMVEVYGPHYADNSAGRMLQSVAKQDPRIVGLLHSLGLGASSGRLT
jgi:ribosome maturation factor RimP